MFIMFLVLFFFQSVYAGLYEGFLLANMFPLFMAPLYQRAKMSMLLCGTLTSEYVLRCYMLLLQANIEFLSVTSRCHGAENLSSQQKPNTNA